MRSCARSKSDEENLVRREGGGSPGMRLLARGPRKRRPEQQESHVSWAPRCYRPGSRLRKRRARAGGHRRACAKSHAGHPKPFGAEDSSSSARSGTRQKRGQADSTRSPRGRALTSDPEVSVSPFINYRRLGRCHTLEAQPQTRPCRGKLRIRFLQELLPRSPK